MIGVGIQELFVILLFIGLPFLFAAVLIIVVIIVARKRPERAGQLSPDESRNAQLQRVAVIEQEINDLEALFKKGDIDKLDFEQRKAAILDRI